MNPKNLVKPNEFCRKDDFHHVYKIKDKSILIYFI